jgi:hypothetical protein
MGLLRSILSLALLGVFLLVGFTVPVGERTLFGHVANIWSSDEAQELVEGVKDSSGPLVDRVKRGVEAGLADQPDVSVDPSAGVATADEEDSIATPTPVVDEGDKQQ